MPPKVFKGKGRGKRTADPVPDTSEGGLLEETTDIIPETQALPATPEAQEDPDEANTPPPTSSGDWGKKKKVPENLSAAQEQTLADWFSEQPMFFDQTHRDFKDRQKKDRLLADKGKELGMSGKHNTLHCQFQYYTVNFIITLSI